MCLCNCLCQRFEETFDNAQWGKVKQMQPVWLCILSSKRFEDTFENPQWRKSKQMQPVCDFASIQAGDLRTHLKMHSGEKSNKCNQCDFTCSDPSSFRTHLKTHSGEKLKNATNTIMHPLRQAIWGHIWRHTVEKSQFHRLKQAIWGDIWEPTVHYAAIHEN